MDKYFKKEDTLFDICEKYPETIPVFVSNGFAQMEKAEKRESFGKTISLSTALSLKKINIDSFSALLIEKINLESEVIDNSLRVAKNKKADTIKIEGLLPCPVRIPLLEQLEEFIKENGKDWDHEVEYNLKAASMGLDWLKELVLKENDADKIPDIFISAGFDLFFEEELMGKFKKKDVFSDGTGLAKFNSDFDNENISLVDPKRHYSIIGVVPAVFLVNKKELNGRDVPRTWADILKPEFKQSVSLPIGDFDLFNAILLNIEKMYGREAIKKLGESLISSMHPSEMVKSDRKKSNRPTVTIMPYFFTKMVKPGGTMEAVWPEDGAIISPIFMLTKKSKMDKLQPLIDLFASVKIGEILAHKGLFPSTVPGVDNRLKEGNKFQWIGWDFIYNNNVGKIIEECNAEFNSSMSIEV